MTSAARSLWVRLVLAAPANRWLAGLCCGPIGGGVLSEGRLKVLLVVFFCLCCLVLFVQGGVFDELGDVDGAFRGGFDDLLAVLEPLLRLDSDGLRRVVVLPLDEAVPLRDSVVLIAHGVLVDRLPAEDGDMFLLPELLVLQHGVGCDDGESENCEGDDDEHVEAEFCSWLVGFVSETEAK